MEVSPIQKLPEEVLLNIFALLPGSVLMECCLVQSTWNKLITSSRKTMTKISFYFNGAWHNQEPLRFQRKFTRATVCNVGSKYLLELLHAQRSSITHLSLSASYISQFHTIIRQIPNLEILTVNNVAFSKLEPFSLPKLKKFEYFENAKSQPLIEYLEGTANITNLAIDGENLTSHLGKFPSLQQLYIHGCNSYEGLIGASFKLKKLHLSFSTHRTDSKYIKHLLEFMSLHANSLEELQISNLNSLIETPQVAYLVLNGFPKIKCLDFDIDILPDNLEFFERIEPLKNVISLQFHGKFKQKATAEAFWKLFPNLQDVHLTDLSNFPTSSPNFIFGNMQGVVRYLSFNMQSNTIKTATIYLEHIEFDLNQFLKIIKSNLQLTILSIYTPRNFEWFPEIISAVMDLPMLKKLRLHCSEARDCPKAAVDAFNLIKRDFKHLQYFEFTWEYQRFWGTGHLGCIHFHIPSDRSNWNSDRYEEKIRSFIPTKSTIRGNFTHDPNDTSQSETESED